MTSKTNRGAGIALCLIGGLTLAACSRVGPDGELHGAGDDRICTPFPGAAATAPGMVADSGAAVDDCLHRWAYTLAKAKDPADVVGKAAVSACASTLTAWNQASLGQGGPDALSLTTGQPTNAMAAHGEYAQARALFYVVQARAGNCAPPPAPTPKPIR